MVGKMTEEQLILELSYVWNESIFNPKPDLNNIMLTPADLDNNQYSFHYSLLYDPLLVRYYKVFDDTVYIRYDVYSNVNVCRKFTKVSECDINNINRIISKKEKIND